MSVIFLKINTRSIAIIHQNVNQYCTKNNIYMDKSGKRFTHRIFKENIITKIKYNTLQPIFALFLISKFMQNFRLLNR